MPAEGWKLISLASAVQVLSEGVFFAQGILANEDINSKSSGKKDLDWIRICVPLFYAAVRQISEPCWRWILRGYGDRMTTALGAATISISIVTASCHGKFLGNAAYVILGGIGMGLVRLQFKLMKSYSDQTKWPLWGACISGIGLSLWPLVACSFVESLGTRYAMLILAGITLHAVPLAIFVQPIAKNRSENRESDDAVRPTYVASCLPNFRTYPSHYVRPALPETSLNSQLQELRLSSKVIEYDSYRIRPSNYVEVLPGIPEEAEHESDHERDHEMQRAVSETAETVAICEGIKIGDRKSPSHKKERGKKSEGRKIQKKLTKNQAEERQRIETKPFAYTIFVTTILLRLGDQFCVTIVISILPIFAGYLLPNVRLQEKAFLISLCGFSKILSEFPLLGLYAKSKKSKYVFIAGPLSAAVALCLIWNSTNLDSMTLASFGLGIGSGAASAALQVMTPKESPGVSDTADIIIACTLLAIVPLTRILILGHAVQGCLLLAAGIYGAAAITSIFSMRKGA